MFAFFFMKIIKLFIFLLYIKKMFTDQRQHKSNIEM